MIQFGCFAPSESPGHPENVTTVGTCMFGEPHRLPEQRVGLARNDGIRVQRVAVTREGADGQPASASIWRNVVARQ